MPIRRVIAALLMSSVVHDHQLREGPQAVQRPRRRDRRLKIEPPVHKYARNPRKPVHLSQHTSIAKPRIVTDIMRDQPRVGHRERRIAESSGQFRHRRPIRGGGLPYAPGESSLFADHRIRIVQQAAVRLDDIALTIGDRNSAAATLP